MVRLLRLTTLLALPALSLAQLGALEGAGESVVKGVLSKLFRFNSSQVAKVMSKDALPANPFVCASSPPRSRRVRKLMDRPPTFHACS